MTQFREKEIEQGLKEGVNPKATRKFRQAELLIS